MSAAEKAAQIKEQLAAKSIEQAAIAEQALKAIENGLDPKIAAELALAATNENTSAQPALAEVESVASSTNWPMVKIRFIGDNHGRPFVSNFGSAETGPYTIHVDEKGEAIVPKPIADIATLPGLGFALAE